MLLTQEQAAAFAAALSGATAAEFGHLLLGFPRGGEVYQSAVEFRAAYNLEPEQ